MVRLLPALLLLTGCVELFQPRTEPTPPITTDPCTDPDTWYYDADGDGYGGESETWRSCTRPSFLWAATATDCDDNDAGTFPGAIEVCDGVDRDCNGIVDDATEAAPRWYPDDDGDDYPNMRAEPVFQCTRPGGYVQARPHDCNDTDPTVHPGAADPPCDGINQSCLPGIDKEVARVGDQVFHDVGAALSAAGGHEVLVCPGVHDVPPIHSDSGLHVTGLGGGPDVVELRSTGGRLFDVRGGDVQLTDLTLSGGHARATETDDGSGGALRAVSGTITLQRLVLLDHRAEGSGGALHLTADALLLEDIDARRLQADGDGGGLHATLASAGTLRRLSVLDAHAGGHGGVLDVRVTGTDASLTLRDTTLSHATAGTDGGAIHVDSAAEATELENVYISATRAQGEGGHLALRASSDHRLDLKNVRLTQGSAVKGGLVHGRASGELEVGFRTATLVDGHAESGGLVHLDSVGSPVDVDISGSSFTRGTAEQGGLFHVVSADQGDFYCNTADFSWGRASRGAAILITGELTHDTEVDMDSCPITDNQGAPALEVDAELEGTVLVQLVAPGTRLHRNPDGGVAVPGGATLRLRNVDLGTGTNENGAFDLRSGGDTWDGSGTGVWVTCLFGTCTEE